MNCCVSKDLLSLIVQIYFTFCLYEYCNVCVCRNDTSSICPAERLLAMQASAAQEQEHEPEQELSGSEGEEDEGESPEDETNAIMDAGLFQPIQQEKRQK